MEATRADIPHINYILSQNDVFEYCIDSSFPEEERWSIGRYLFEAGTTIYLPNEYIVLTAKTLINIEMVHVHVAVAPGGRGLEAITETKRAIQYYWDHNPEVCKMVGIAPSYNKRLLRFATLVGFKREGLLTNSLIVDGRLQDQVVFGLSREIT